MDVFNTTLHLAASLILVSPDLPGERARCEFAVQTLKVVCGRGKWEWSEVELVMGFFQELTTNLELFMEVRGREGEGGRVG